MTTPYAGTSQASTLKQGPKSRTNQAAKNNMRPYMTMFYHKGHAPKAHGPCGRTIWLCIFGKHFGLWYSFKGLFVFPSTSKGYRTSEDYSFFFYTQAASFSFFSACSACS